MTEVLPNRMDRVRANTCAEVNRRIDQRIEDNIHLYSSQPRHVLENRILELDDEWDIERVLGTMAPSITLVGLALGAFVNLWWLLLPVAVMSFYLLHSIQGWCPPLPVLRRMGKRTRNEIDAEKFAMKALLGDFDGLGNATNRLSFVEKTIDAIRTYDHRNVVLNGAPKTALPPHIEDQQVSDWYRKL